MTRHPLYTTRQGPPLRMRLMTALAGTTCLTVCLAASAAEPLRSGGVDSPAAKAIARLLETETSPGKASLQTVERVYREALGAAPRDPRVEYAYSLVLLRIFEPNEARKHLEKALELDPAFAPAHQSVIRDQIKARRFAEAGERLSAFAETLDQDHPDSPHVAEWMGRIVSAVISAVGTPDAKAQFGYHDRLFRTSLPPALLASYERGFLAVEREFDELTAAIELARSSADNRRETAKAQIDGELKKDQNEIKQKLQDAQKSRQKWDEWITDQTAKADDLLREQEKRFQDLDRAISTQQQSVIALQLGIDRVERGIASTTTQQQSRQQNQDQDQNRNRTPRPPLSQAFVPFASGNVASVELQLAVEQQRLAGLFDQQAAVARQASQTLAARKAAVAQYQQATGVVLKEAANLDRWEKRNKTIADNMKKAAEKKPTQVATLEARIRNLNTWDPGDFETEKRRLLGELGMQPKDDPPAAAQAR